MGLLKIIFEVNLGLFGKREEYVSPHLPLLPPIIPLQL
jgi:hypothetical protein